jgi:hypothetical protein
MLIVLIYLCDYMNMNIKINKKQINKKQIEIKSYMNIIQIK